MTITQHAARRTTVRNEQALIGVAVNCFPTLFSNESRPTIDDVAQALNKVAEGQDASQHLRDRAQVFVEKYHLNTM